MILCIYFTDFIFIVKCFFVYVCVDGMRVEEVEQEFISNNDNLSTNFNDSKICDNSQNNSAEYLQDVTVEEISINDLLTKEKSIVAGDQSNELLSEKSLIEYYDEVTGERRFIEVVVAENVEIEHININESNGGNSSINNSGIYLNFYINKYSFIKFQNQDYYYYFFLYTRLSTF